MQFGRKIFFFCVNFNYKKIKKNVDKERSSSVLSTEQMPPLPLLNQSADFESRSRSESIRDKTKILNEQINDVPLFYFIIAQILIAKIFVQFFYDLKVKE